MKDIFHYSPYVTHKKHNLYIHTQNATKFGNKSLRAFGANIWNTFPEYIKSTSSLLEFKQLSILQPDELQKKKYTSSLYYFDKSSTFEAHFVKLNQHFNVNLKYTSSILKVYFLEV